MIAGLVLADGFLWVLLILALFNAIVYIFRAIRFPNRPTSVQGLVTVGLSFLAMAVFYGVCIHINSNGGMIALTQAGGLAGRAAVLLVLVFVSISNIHIILTGGER